jgi:hypothetical protein
MFYFWTDAALDVSPQVGTWLDQGILKGEVSLYI